MRVATVLVSGIGSLACAGSLTAAEARFTGVGFRCPTAVSGDGSTVVGYSGYVPSGRAMRWTWNEGVLELGDLPGGDDASTAYGVSGDGSVIVGTGTWGQLVPPEQPGEDELGAFRWTQEGGIQFIGDLPGGSVHSGASGVSQDGRVIVGSSVSGSYGALPVREAYRWTAEEGMVSLGRLSDSTGVKMLEAVSASADGSVIAGSGDVLKGGREAFRWTASEGMVGLGQLPIPGDFHSIALAISANGEAVVGHSHFRAFRWTQEDGMAPLVDLSDDMESMAYSVSGDGSVVVGYYYEDSFRRGAFMWDPQHGLRDLKTVLTTDFGLDLTGWRLDRATAISADGLTIVGWGTNPTYGEEGWVARLPEPSTLAPFILWSFLIAHRRRSIPTTCPLARYKRQAPVPSGVIRV